MAHFIRPQRANQTLHVTAHALTLLECFPTDSARLEFQRLLEESLQRHPVEVHAFAWMSNHLHLLVTGRADGAIVRFMQALLSRHSLLLNRELGRRGALWEDRHRTTCVDSEDHLLKACLYIDANPWRAGVVEHPRDSGWSSFRRLAGIDDPGWLTVHPVLEQLAGDRGWHATYSALMDEYLARAQRVSTHGRGRPVRDPFQGLRLASWPVGSM